MRKNPRRDGIPLPMQDQITVPNYLIKEAELTGNMKISEALEICKKHLTHEWEEANTVRTPYIENALMKSFAYGDITCVLAARAQQALLDEIRPLSLLADFLWTRGKIPEEYVKRPYTFHPLKVEIDVYNKEYVTARNEWLTNFILKLQKDNS